MHAEGEDGKLFGKLSNLRRDLASAAVEAGIPHVWPHALRKARGQWLIDLGVPLEIVSRVLGHADTRITELVYCRVSDELIWDRMGPQARPDSLRRRGGLADPQRVGEAA